MDETQGAAGTCRRAGSGVPPVQMTVDEMLVWLCSFWWTEGWARGAAGACRRAGSGSRRREGRRGRPAGAAGAPKGPAPPPPSEPPGPPTPATGPCPPPSTRRTANIHDAVHGGVPFVMGAGYHSLHHTAVRCNYGQYLVLMDWLHSTLRAPEGGAGDKAKPAAPPLAAATQQPARGGGQAEPPPSPRRLRQGQQPAGGGRCVKAA
jgi:hypothetical protein